MLNSRQTILGGLLSISLGALSAFSQAQLPKWGYAGCDSITPLDFTITPIVTQGQVKTQAEENHIMEPLKMAFDKTADGKISIFFVERGGKIRLWDATAQKLLIVGTIPLSTGTTPGLGWEASNTANEDGLVGIALHPDFRKGKPWVYLNYSRSINGNSNIKPGEISGTFRIARYTYDLIQQKINMGSETVLLDIPSGRGRFHTAGGMQFDEYGDLWITIGDNESNMMGPLNTADLRGKILRITPKDDGTYSIPTGNLWEYARDYFKGKGDNTTASEYEDVSKVKREVFAMGTRNAYSIGIDPVRRWVSYGDCGPDVCNGSEPGCVTEEHSLATKPSFMGWGTWSGKDYNIGTLVYGGKDPGENSSFWMNGQDQNAPINPNTNKKGVKNLLPHTPAIHAYNHACAVTAPLYRYNPNNPNPNKIPPHFDRTIFGGDFNQKKVYAIQATNDGKLRAPVKEVFSQALRLTIGTALDFQVGPDGELYWLAYSGGAWRTKQDEAGIYRIGYKGKACNVGSSIVFEKSGCTTPGQPGYDASIPKEFHNEKMCSSNVPIYKQLNIKGGIVVGNVSVAVDLEGSHTLQVLDLKGTPVFTGNNSGKKTYQLDKLNSYKGIHFIKVITPNKTYSDKIYLP